MPRNKQQFKNTQGFTLIELLVVMFIMLVLTTSTLIIWNQQKPKRSLNIAQNEFITNVRKMQSYAVSARNITSNVPAKYYVMRIAEGESSYSINAIGADFTYFPNIETISLPDGLTFSDLQLRPTGSLTTATPTCVMLVVSSPFGKMYFDTVSECGSTVSSTVQDLPILASLSDKDLDVIITHAGQGISRSSGIHGLTGRVESNE